MKMKNSRKLQVITSIFILVAVFASTTYIKSTSTFAEIEIENVAIPEVNNDTKKLEEQQRLDKEKKLQEQKKIEDQKILDAQKKLDDQKKIDEQNKIQAQKKLEEQNKLKQQQVTKTQTSSSKSTNQISPPIAPKPASKLLIDKINGKGNARQAIVVTTNGFGRVSSTITTFEKTNEKWIQVASFSGNIGKNGFVYNKVEGDGHSPIGIFTLGTAFGKYSNPSTKMNYRKSTANDFWVDDSNSPLYNTWQKGPVSGRWTSAENMYISAYNYGFVINYNTSKRIPGKGSAIFFHVGSGKTAGCTSTSQNNVISILKWLNPSKAPIIIEGPMSEVLKM
jgi:L,D-peptidoglycan transpeptidase YkuD (ErfK/YbiS/YcfS/YnhG family)